MLRFYAQRASDCAGRVDQLIRGIETQTGIVSRPVTTSSLFTTLAAASGTEMDTPGLAPPLPTPKANVETPATHLTSVSMLAGALSRLHGGG